MNLQHPTSNRIPHGEQLSRDLRSRPDFVSAGRQSVTGKGIGVGGAGAATSSSAAGATPASFASSILEIAARVAPRLESEKVQNIPSSPSLLSLGDAPADGRGKGGRRRRAPRPGETMRLAREVTNASGEEGSAQWSKLRKDLAGRGVLTHFGVEGALREALERRVVEMRRDKERRRNAQNSVSFELPSSPPISSLSATGRGRDRERIRSLDGGESEEVREENGTVAGTVTSLERFSLASLEGEQLDVFPTSRRPSRLVSAAAVGNIGTSNRNKESTYERVASQLSMHVEERQRTNSLRREGGERGRYRNDDPLNVYNGALGLVDML